MKNVKEGSCVKIRHFQYSSVLPKRQLGKSRSTERNPIKIVVDKIGMDGEVSQLIVDQN